MKKKDIKYAVKFANRVGWIKPSFFKYKGWSELIFGKIVIYKFKNDIIWFADCVKSYTENGLKRKQLITFTTDFSLKKVLVKSVKFLKKHESELDFL